MSFKCQGISWMGIEASSVADTRILDSEVIWISPLFFC